jgi:DNA polymerase I-like protein with 3'-5' exonuclease and polymerase domains
MRILSLDTETFLIGPGAIAPKMVCFSTAERINDQLVTHISGNGDVDVALALRLLFTDENVRLVLHNAAYDLTVIATSYPELEPLIWDALEAGRITDTKIREQLLNLSTHGHLDSIFLPDGSAQTLSYSLSTLTLKWLGIDTSHLKEGDDIWRLNYHTLDGLRADQYPRDAQDYALGDAQHTLQVYEEQERSKEVEGSTETEFFQTAVDFALRWITIAGMAVDPARFAEMQAHLAEELSEDKLQPLVDAGIMRAAEPPRPYARQVKKVAELLLEWTGRTDGKPEDFQTELEGAGIKFKDAEPSGITKEMLQRRILAVQLSLAFGDSIEHYLPMELDEMVALSEEAGVKFKTTDKGGVSTDSEVIADVAEADEVLNLYQHRQSLQKLVSTELPRMMWEGKVAPRVHWPFKVLLETGRTSSSADKLFPSGNGQQIHPKVRPIFVPSKGGLFVSTDYSTLELVCVAQTMLDKFGYSKHAEKINAGYDLHAYLGAQLALRLSPHFRELLKLASVNASEADDCYELFRSLKQDEPIFYKHWRKFAKPIGLGFPGGLGPFKMLALAKKTYGVNIVEEAEKLFAEHPEILDRDSGSVRYWAKKLYGMQKESSDWTPTLKGIALAKLLRDVWFDTYPEMREYFAALQASCTDLRFEEDFDNDRDSLSYTSPFGMLRAGCSYTAAANGEAMQTPAAEGFKAACFHLVKECRLGRLKGRAQVVNEIHDETIVEVFRAEDGHDVAMIVKEVMEEAMKLVIRDVKVKAEPCLMLRWHKEAEPAYKDGTLVPWEPKL